MNCGRAARTVDGHPRRERHRVGRLRHGSDRVHGVGGPAMMRRGRIVDALVCLLATWAAILPLRSPFATLDWVNLPSDSPLVVARSVPPAGCSSRSRWGGGTAVRRRGHHLGTAPAWVPVARVYPLRTRPCPQLAARSGASVVTFSAPAPMNHGMIVAPHRGRPGCWSSRWTRGRRHPSGSPARRLPLLAATSSPRPTPAPTGLVFLRPPAALWLTTRSRGPESRVCIAGRPRFRRDGGGRGRDGVDGFSSAARNLGVVAAVITALPDRPGSAPPATRFLGDGLGRAARATGKVR